MSYLNPLLRSHYFRFCKANDRHVKILLSLSILTSCHHSHGILHLFTNISSKWNNSRWSYDVVTSIILKDDGRQPCLIMRG